MNSLKNRLLGSVIGLTGLCSSASAQVLSDFSDFHVPDYTFFGGDWTSGGEPLPSFVQGSGYYEIKGGTNNSTAEVFRYFGSGGDYLSIDASGGFHLNVSAKTLSGNQSASFTVNLYDAGENQAYAIFNTSAFNPTDFTSVQSVISSSGSFDYSTVSYFRISGDTINGSAAFNVAFDEVAITSAVPEPSTYALALGALALMGSLYRRQRHIP